MIGSSIEKLIKKKVEKERNRAEFRLIEERTINFALIP